MAFVKITFLFLFHVLFSILQGRDSGIGTEYFGKIVIVRISYISCYLLYGQYTFLQ